MLQSSIRVTWGSGSIQLSYINSCVPNKACPPGTLTLVNLFQTQYHSLDDTHGNSRRNTFLSGNLLLVSTMSGT